VTDTLGPYRMDLFGDSPVARAIDRLREFVPPEGYYLAFSGGKDSICLLRCAELAGVKFDAHMSMTTADPPPLVRFVKRYYPQVRRHPPASGRSLAWMIRERGLPTRRVRWCCEEYKEIGGRGRRVATGIRSAESPRRRNRKMVESCLRDKTTTFVHPMKDWTDADVWDFIRAEHLPYPDLYDQGWKRIGCILCPFASAQERARAESMWPSMFRVARQSTDLFWIKSESARSRFASGAAMFDWWMAKDLAYPQKLDEQEEEYAAMFGDAGEEDAAAAVPLSEHRAGQSSLFGEPAPLCGSAALRENSPEAMT